MHRSKCCWVAFDSTKNSICAGVRIKVRPIRRGRAFSAAVVSVGSTLGAVTFMFVPFGPDNDRLFDHLSDLTLWGCSAYFYNGEIGLDIE